MEGKRPWEDATYPLWEESVYQKLVPADHFLRRLDAALDWEALSVRLLALCAERGEARPLYHPVRLLKMLLLVYVYHLSDEQMVELVQDNVPMRWFLGLALYEQAPDAIVLRDLRARIVAQGQVARLGTLLQEIVRRAQARGVRFDTFRIVTSGPTPIALDLSRSERQPAAEGAPPHQAAQQQGSKRRRARARRKKTK